MRTTRATTPGRSGGLTPSVCIRAPAFCSSPPHTGGTMRGRDFLVVAVEVARGGTEAHWRTAAGRAYYALLLEIRDAMTSWGISAPIPSQVHQLVRRRLFASSDPDIKRIGIMLADLRGSRNRADYEIDVPHEFAVAAGGRQAVHWSTDGLTLLDVVNVDKPRRDTI